MDKLTLKVGDTSYEWDAKKVGQVEPPDPVEPVEPPTETGKRIGINTHPWINPSLLGNIKLHRQYLSSYYFWTGKGGKIKPQPMVQGGTPQAWGLDDILTKAKNEGAEVLFTIHQTPTWLINQNRTDGGGDYLPVEAGESRTNPDSYYEYALMLAQIVARYGRVKYPDDQLEVDLSERWTGDKNEKKSGLNLLKYIQFWNEEKWWKAGTPEHVLPEEMAAMMIKCYDFIKKADPSMIVVSPCISDISMPYFEAMDKVFNGVWPCDIISCNYYLNKGNDGRYPATWVLNGGCGPSQDKGFGRVKQLAEFCAKRGKKLWVTECGLDDETATQSQMSFQGNETARAAALIETANAMFDSGVDAVFFFTAADEYNAGKTLYQRCGILQGQDKGYAKKASFDIVNNYAKTLNAKSMQNSTMQETDRTKRFVIPPK